MILHVLDLLLRKFDIILASASPRRKELLSSIGMQFRVVPSQFDESSVPLPSAEFDPKCVELICEGKAHDVWEKEKSMNALVISSDTVVVAPGGKVLGKPKSDDEAVEMLTSLRGRWHEVVSAVCIMRNSGKKTFHVSTRVHMANIGDDEIISYVNSHEPRDKAGAYGIQGLGGCLIDKLDGCYYTVVGLPLHRLCDELSRIVHEEE